MNNEAMKEVLNELFSHLERLETQNAAILQFLKEKKRVTDKQLAPYLEQAGNASSVRWRAARVRIDHLLEPEHPEKEIKLGKQPELHEEPARAGASDAESAAGSSEESQNESTAKKDKRTASVDQESKRTESGDQKQIESSDKDVKKTEPQNAEAADADLSKKERSAPAEAAQGQDKEKSDSVYHPSEVTSELAKQEGVEPAAQLESKEKKSDQEAA
jgi:hypothetical protein